MPKTYIVFTDAEREFITRVTGQPLSAAAVRAALRLLAEGQLGVGFAGLFTPPDVGELFLPRQRGANLRQVPREKKSAAAKKRWQTDGQEARQRQGKIMRAARKQAKTKKGDD